MAQVQQLLAQTNARIAQLEAENTQLRNNAITKAKLEMPLKYRGSKEDLARWLV
jgi:F0F1-type ATP synthase membrane subunit b/b'